jgi:hypothetical protein
MTNSNSKSEIDNSASSITACAERGRHTFHQWSRSVLSHPIVILLVFEINLNKWKEIIATFISNDDNRKKYLRSNLLHWKDLHGGCRKKVTQIFESSFIDNKIDRNTTETQISTSIASKLNDRSVRLPFQVICGKTIKSSTDSGKQGKIDILLKADSEISESFTPIMMMKVGLSHDEWWEKFDHCTQYLEMLPHSTICFHKPILMAVVTVDRDNDSHNVTLKMAVFFCCQNSGDEKNCQMTLLWHARGNFDLFGSLFALAHRFQQMVDEYETNKNELSTILGYEYFSSNCCKIGNKVRLQYLSMVFCLIFAIQFCGSNF